MTNLKLLERPRSGAVREGVRLVVSRVYGPLNLATSTYTRMRSPIGALTEVVELDGAADGMSGEELERFISGFPLRQAQQGR
jgi:hypothetical protein